MPWAVSCKDTCAAGARMVEDAHTGQMQVLLILQNKLLSSHTMHARVRVKFCAKEGNDCTQRQVLLFARPPRQWWLSPRPTGVGSLATQALHLDGVRAVQRFGLRRHLTEARAQRASACFFKNSLCRWKSVSMASGERDRLHSA